MTEAAPSVGPTQGVQTAPRSSPTPNCPEIPEVENPPKRLWVQLLTGPAAVANCVCMRGTISTMPTRISNIAAAERKAVMSRPTEKPIVATNNPIAVKERATPAARPSGANRCCATAPAKTTGTRGRTQGDRIDRTPAKNASSII
jgi:hypothetical protein